MAGAVKPLVPKIEDASNLLKKRKRRPRVTVKIKHPQHGKIEVYSMRGDLVTMTSAAVPEAGPVWTPIARQGDFQGHSAGPFKMTLGTFNEIIANFRKHPEELPFDFEHATHADPSSGSIPHSGAPAQGWIKDLKVEDGKLWALVEWGELARDYIKAGKYKYVSPTIAFGAKDRESGKPIGARLLSAALTNLPFLSGLGQVAAKDMHDDGSDEDAEDNDSAAADHTDEEDDNMEAAQALKDTEAKLAVMSDKHALADEKARTAEKIVTAKDAEITTLKAENNGLMAWKTAREEKDQTAEIEVAFETYKDQRKLTDDMRGPMLAMLKAAPDAFRTMYPTVAVGHRHLLREVSTRREEAPREMASGAELPAGITLSDPAAVVKLADYLQVQNGKLDRAHALNDAHKTIRAAMRGGR